METDKMKEKLIKFFKFVTNNNRASEQHELDFDITFFVIITISLFVGIGLLIKYHAPEWIAFLVIEYIWCWDSIRNNRD